MGGTWIAPEQRHVWAEVRATGSSAPFWGFPGSYGWLTGGVPAPRRVPVPQEEMPDLERAPARDARGGGAARPLAAAGRAGRRRSRQHPVRRVAGSISTLPRTRATSARVLHRRRVGSAVGGLDPRGRALARRRRRQHLALARRPTCSATSLARAARRSSTRSHATPTPTCGSTPRSLAVVPDASGVTVRTGGASPGEHRARPRSSRCR